jgi:peptidoglycan/LPS O-acetylase OafA/YrhL
MTSFTQTLRDRLDRLFFNKKSSSNIQIESLDGLRGIAVLIVFLAHLSFSHLDVFPGFTFYHGGAPGVFLFFALSSFLLSLPMLSMDASELKNPYLWANYGVRRVFRILPLYYSVLLSSYLATRYTRRTFMVHLSFRDLTGHLLMQEGKAVFWSIPVEFKYYLALPVVVFFFVIAFRHGFLKSAIFSAVIIVLAQMFCKPFGSKAALLSLSTYIPIFLSGSLAALIHVKLKESGAAKNRNIRLLFEITAACCFMAYIITVPTLWSALEVRNIVGHGIGGNKLIYITV